MSREAESVKAFETWMQEEYPNVTLEPVPDDCVESEDDRYDDIDAQMAWEAWLAATKHVKKTMCNRN